MTKQILVGGVPVGGNAPIPIQSMCNTRTDDVAATVAQIKRLEAAGCEIIRVAVPDMPQQGPSGRSGSRYPFRWWWTSISTIGWHWRQ